MPSFIVVLRFVSLGGLATTVGCSPGRSAELPNECVGPALPDSVSPSRDGFLREALFAQPTARTPRFDAYSPTNYSASKLDVTYGLAEMAAKCGVRLEGSLVIGPVGPLWAYYVVSFLADGRSIRMNTVIMPHARVTGKGTGVVPRRVMESLFEDLSRTSSIRSGLPITSESIPPGLGREFSYDLLLARYEGKRTRYWHGSLFGNPPDTNAQQIAHRFEALMAMTKQTYPDTASVHGRAP